jgi:glycosyltransferase involved in cell wall biosynthesis
MVALEGAIAGVPVIISKEAGVTELVKSLKSIPYWDTHTWVKESISMLDKPSKASQYSERLTREVKRLNWKLVGEQVKDLYIALK